MWPFTDLTGYRDAFAFVLLIIILLVRPTGLLGKNSGEGVRYVEQEKLIYRISLLLFVIFIFWADKNWDPYKMRILILCGIYVILALSLNLINGFRTVFTWYSWFMAVGAYTSALLAMSPEMKEMAFSLSH